MSEILALSTEIRSLLKEDLMWGNPMFHQVDSLRMVEREMINALMMPTTRVAIAYRIQIQIYGPRQSGKGLNSETPIWQLDFNWKRQSVEKAKYRSLIVVPVKNRFKYHEEPDSKLECPGEIRVLVEQECYFRRNEHVERAVRIFRMLHSQLDAQQIYLNYDLSVLQENPMTARYLDL